MSYEEKRDPRLGPTVIAYPQPPGFAWLLVGLGVALALVGAVGVPMVLETLGVATRQAASDLWTGLFLALALMPGGLGLLVWGVLERVRRPEWHLCEHGLVRLSTGKATNLFFWRDVETFKVVRVLQHGRVIGCNLQLGKKRIFAPTEAVANRAYELWAKANPTRVPRVS